MNTASQKPSESESKAVTAPSVANPQNIHWAAEPGTVKTFDMEEQFEVARARNWINERLISQCQRHWSCTREKAIERLLTQHA